MNRYGKETLFNMGPLKAAYIGVGQKSQADYLPAIHYSRYAALDSVCDSNVETLGKVSQEYGVPGFSSIDHLLSERKPDFAFVCVPHHLHIQIATKLLEAGIPVLKEKPFAITIEDAAILENRASKTGTLIEITVTRRFHPLYQACLQLLPHIGNVYSVEARYTLNIARLDEGWRAKKALAGGGALLDMAYHLIDLLVWYFGLPHSMSAHIGLTAKPHQVYDVEDTVSLLLNYQTQMYGDFVATVFASRAFPCKQEHLVIVGTEGSIELNRDEVKRIDRDGKEVEALVRRGSWITAATEQIDSFASLILHKQRRRNEFFLDHFKHLAIIHGAYAASEGKKVVDPREYIPVTIRNQLNA